jgi:uncharacterized YccA/Bax inhibitor family protein
MRTSNPVLGNDAFETTSHAGQSSVMTVEGTSLKTGILLILAAAAAAVTWQMAAAGHPATMGVIIGGALGGLVIAIVTCFKPTWSPITAPLYAVAEGLFLGAISAMYNNAFYPGIVFQAVCLTFGTLFALLIAYQSGWIKVTEKFRAGIIAATGAIMLVYLIAIGMRMFGAEMPFLHSSGPIGIGISLVIVVIAALNLVLDFDFIDRGAQMGAPKYMEWYGAFGLMVTLVWLYLEILRLLAKLNRR